VTKDEEIAMLKATNAVLLQKITVLEEKVLQLFQIIEKLGIKKNSSNSHNSPSQDKSKPKRNRSLRTKSNRKSGGQEGHKGHTLKMTETPDKTKVLRSDYCSSCGSGLHDLVHQLISKRQEVIIPPIVPQIVEYQQFACRCSCGHYQKAAYPSNINAPIQFGSEIVALVSYFNVFQYVPYRRLKLLFKDVFNLSISEGSIENLLKKGATKSQTVYQTIFENIKNANYVGSDETGVKVNGEKFWIWVWQNVKNTFLKASSSRGFDTVESLFPEGLPDTIIA
jgi:transposase